MRLIPSDPDIRTVFGRIADDSLDLQPEFQRGEVWSQPKQKLLIDSVLRSWYVPPIHVVRIDEDTQVVLDGQQRLRAIELFVRGRFAVDGRNEPVDPAIEALHGLRYDQLPPKVRGRFDRFTLRLFELVDYQPDEPSELFFRLNQPATLTAAEKRNAFFGHARRQVRELTESAQQGGMRPERIGFSSARLAYEDVVARFVVTLEAGSLAEKATASRITARYRSTEPISEEVMRVAEESLRTVFGARSLDDPAIRLNKATAHSWLLYVARAAACRPAPPMFDDYFDWFERFRAHQREMARQDPDDPLVVAVTIFNNRATARVNDVSSVLLRDVILWALSVREAEPWWPAASPLWDALQDGHALDEDEQPRSAEERVLDVANGLGWANLS